jgi:hypothetical protein
VNTSVNTSAASPANGESSVQDLFALTDEQILEIAPEAERSNSEDSVAAASATNHQSPATSHQTADQGTSAQPQLVVPPEPPTWLAARMKDPWNGEEARELWNGVQQAKQEAAAYRAAFANPEDARALKELYPGGVSEARAAAERARVLDDIDRAYFAGDTAQRSQLAQMMLREDPAAFREMVFEGLRALEGAGKQGNGTPSNTAASLPATDQKTLQDSGPTLRPRSGQEPGATQVQHESPVTSHESQVAAYASFEKAANEELERSVGGAIERTLAQALPNASRVSNASGVGAQHAAPLQARLSAAIRQDVEAALKGDRQLSEQVAQILSGRRLDNETRAQVVRLIGERAQQLVPVAAKRVLSDWTQTTLAAHHSRNQKTETTAARKDVSVANAGPNSSSSRTAPPKSVDYRKLSDEQILNL